MNHFHHIMCLNMPQNHRSIIISLVKYRHFYRGSIPHFWTHLNISRLAYHCINPLCTLYILILSRLPIYKFLNPSPLDTEKGGDVKNGPRISNTKSPAASQLPYSPKTVSRARAKLRCAFSISSRTMTSGKRAEICSFGIPDTLW